MDAACGEMVEAELTCLIEKRSSREMDSDDEREELWQESVRAYNARGREEKRLAWASTTRNWPSATELSKGTRIGTTTSPSYDEEVD
jgi:hypothetical protein